MKVFTKYYCSKCGQEFPDLKSATQCYDSHYCVGKIIGVYYEKGKKCPSKVQVEIALDNSDDYQKDVFFEVIPTDWGSK